MPQTDFAVDIDPEFAALCGPLSIAERAQLEANVVAHGCLDPLIVWANHDILLDGHNRLEICTRFDIQFKTKALRFETREEALNWVINNQLGRRNITPEQASYLRGKRYIAEKAGHGGDRKSTPQTDDLKTSERLAQELKVSSATIERDADFAEAIDTIAENLGDDAKRKLLSGDVKASKADVLKLAACAPKEQRAAINSVENGKADSLKAAMPSGPTPHEEAQQDPARRWSASLHKLYVLLNSTRDNGGIRALAKKWTNESKTEYVAELRRIVGELEKWISILENVAWKK